MPEQAALTTEDDAASAIGTTICEEFQRTAAEHAGSTCLRTPGDDFSITWAEAATRVEALARGLAALGVGRGDTVAMLLVNRPEFHLLDWAGLHLGAIPFSMYVTSPAEQVSYLLDNADSKVLVTEPGFLDTAIAARELSGTEAEIVVVDGAEGFMSLDDLAAAGSADFSFEQAWRAVEPDDIATLIYTSGTTGPPKGVQLTHRNLMAAWRASLPYEVGGGAGRVVSYLPHAHLADRFASHLVATFTGSTLTAVADPKQIIALLPDARPSVFIGVPRIWEKLHAALEASFDGLDDAALRERISEALELGRRRARGETLSAEQQASYEAIDAAVFAPTRARIGLDQVSLLVSGAAPIAPEVLEFFAGLGLDIVEVFGMTESSAIATANRPGQPRFGTVGRPAPGVELRLADDGEVLLRGEIVMVGYRKEPEKTAEAIDADGWLHTGDIGELDDEGNLRIVDRKKELIINAAGKNMSPANIERAIKIGSPLIGQVMAVGDGRPYNVGLIVLDADAAAAYAAQRGLADGSVAALAQDPGVCEQIERAVEEGNARLSRVEQIKRYALLGDDWQPGGPELTPTMKLKRRPIREKYTEVIQALYG